MSPTSATVSMAQALQTTMFDHLRSTYPNEGGGFLLGLATPAGPEIREVRPVENVAMSEEQYHRYAMTPSNWARMEDEADSLGLTVVGYYHSHPDSPAIPSEFDRVHALPHFYYLITAVRGGQVAELRAWLLSEDRTTFHEINLI
jgi:proteasome lid subunit RPN8/RPN11